MSVTSQPELKPTIPPTTRDVTLLANTPHELRAHPRWVTWRYELRRERKGGGSWKLTKVLKNPHTGENASSTDPSTWASFAQANDLVASGRMGGFHGVGWVLSEKQTADCVVIGVDLDKCVVDGVIAEWAWEIIRVLDSYTELSPSGQGVRIFIYAALPIGHRSRTGSVEIYSWGRFLTVTGRHVEGTPRTVEQRTNAMLVVHAKIFPPKPKVTSPRSASPSAPASADDRVIVDKIVRSRKWGRLWAGDTTGYTSVSEADLAMVGLIAFYVGNDAGRIDAIFRQSPLCREKWTERQDYRDDTIDRALFGKTDFYDWGKRSGTRRTNRDGTRAGDQDDNPSVRVGARDAAQEEGGGKTSAGKTEPPPEDGTDAWDETDDSGTSPSGDGVGEDDGCGDQRSGGNDGMRHDWSGVLAKRDPLPTVRKFINEKYMTTDGPMVRYDADGTALLFNGVCYEEVKEGLFRSELYLWLETHDRIVKKKDTEEVVPFQPTKGDVDLVIDAMRALTYTSAKDPSWLGDAKGLPDPARLVLAKNGIFELSPAGTRFLRPPTPRFFTRNALDFDIDLGALHPTEWLKFLDQLWPDDREALELVQEWFGYCLTPDTSLQKILLLIGPMRSGKGTIARILMRLIGLANCCGPTLSSLGTNFGLQPFLRKRLAVIDDARLSGKVDQGIITERLLSISGEGTLTVDVKNRAAVTSKLETRILICTNELPRLADASGALASRFLILTMTESYLGREDPTLADRLTRELPAIFNWAVAGWARLQARRRFQQPRTGMEAVEEMRDLASPVGAFVREWCKVGPAHEVPMPELYDGWCAWCGEQGRDNPGISPVFGRDLRAVVPGLGSGQSSDADSRYRVYRGITLTQDAKSAVLRAKVQNPNWFIRRGVA